MTRDTGQSLLRVLGVGVSVVAVIALAVACSFIVDFELPGDGGTDEPGACQRDEDCEDGNPCTAESCGADGFCDTSNAPAGTSCEGVYACVEGETCDGEGNCDDDSGTDVTCASDGNPCTADICSEVHGGCYAPLPAGTDCEGTLFCREGETCDGAGSCDPTSGTPRSCDDDSPCTEDRCDEAADSCTNAPLPEGTSCEGAFFCREGETCDDSGRCDPASGTPRDCADSVPCTADACSETTGECTNMADHRLCTVEGFGWCAPEEPDANAEGCIEGKPCPGGTDAECDDDLFCNGIERCDASRRCVAGDVPICDDGASCTVGDWCNPALDGPDGPGGMQGDCEFPPVHALCDDSLACTSDLCAPEDPDAASRTGCVFRPVTCASDGEPCTLDLCTEDHGGCYPPAPSTTGCEEAFACRTGETCDGAGACDPASGSAVACADDGDPCTLETCDEVFGGCYPPAPSTTSCEGTFSCRTGETCDGAGACDPASGSAVACADDGDPCTLETCDEAFGGCYPPAPSTTSCEGVFACRTGETCDGAGACDPASGSAVTCADDDNPCTLETCDEAFGGCHPPVAVGESCEGTFACRLGETCGPDGACDPTSGTEITTCDAVADGCCPTTCTHVSGGTDFDRDCCDARTCSAASDLCCPTGCTSADDADC